MKIKRFNSPEWKVATYRFIFEERVQIQVTEYGGTSVGRFKIEYYDRQTKFEATIESDTLREGIERMRERKFYFTHPQIKGVVDRLKPITAINIGVDTEAMEDSLVALSYAMQVAGVKIENFKI